MRLISKLIVGAAVASACGYASAAVITREGAAIDPYSRQAAQSVTNGALNVAMPVNIKIEAGYGINDQIVLSPTNGLFASAGTALHTQTFTCSAGAGRSVVFILATTATQNAITYTADAPSGITPGQSCVIPSVMFAANSLTTAGNVQVSSVSVRSTGGNFDTGTAATVASVADEFSVGVGSPFNAVVGVQGGRISFASGFAAQRAGTGLSSTNTDSFSFSVNRASVSTVAGVLDTVRGSMVLSLTAGSTFAFLQEPTGQPGAGSCSVTLGSTQAAATAIGIAGTNVTPTFTTTSGACAVMTVNFNTVVGGEYVLDIGREGAATTTNSTVYPATTFTASVTMAGTSGGSLIATAAAPSAGSWVLDGTTVNVPYVPANGTNLQLFIANRSSQSGPVTFTAWNASGNTCTGTLGTIDSNANGSFGSALRDALRDTCPGQNASWSGAARATVQIVTPTPSSSTTVHSAFTATDNVVRGILINDTNGKANTN